MERHRATYKIYAHGKKHLSTSYKISSEYGKENIKAEMIENYPCHSKEDLLKRDGFHIQNTECVIFVWQEELQHNTKNIAFR